MTDVVNKNSADESEEKQRTVVKKNKLILAKALFCENFGQMSISLKK
jgi:hypothetical protein